MAGEKRKRGREREREDEARYIEVYLVSSLIACHRRRSHAAGTTLLIMLSHSSLTHACIIRRIPRLGMCLHSGSHSGCLCDRASVHDPVSCVVLLLFLLSSVCLSVCRSSRDRDSLLLPSFVGSCYFMQSLRVSLPPSSRIPCLATGRQSGGRMILFLLHARLVQTS